MSASRRRLSNGSALRDISNLENSDDIEDEIQSVASKATTITGSSRRRSSFGLSCKSPPLNPVEQQKIAEMYKTVIKLSAENKLNEKNSWNFDLIDHMGKLIKDESRGVNFQKASCTIDASVKIYSHRVDDTYASSHRILESLSRNAHSNDTTANTGEKSDGNPKKQRVKRTITQTIETKIESLNVARIENEYFVDPMFHKMSKAFDEGGAKGMLMNNIRLSPETCSLSFSTTSATTSAPSSACSNSILDITDLVSKSGIDIDELTTLCVCPVLDFYRSQLNMNESFQPEQALANAESVQSQDISLVLREKPLTQVHVNTLTMAQSNTADANCVDTLPKSDDPPAADDWYGGGDDDGGDDGFQDNYMDHDTTATAVDAKAAGPSITEVVASDSQEKAMQVVEYSDLGESSKEVFVKENEWAGAKHWKYGHRRVPEPVKPILLNTDSDSVTEEVTTKAKKASSKRKKDSTAIPNHIVFTMEFVDEALFETVAETSKKGDANSLRESLREKTAKINETALLLPVDAMYQPKDLCRLFLFPKLIVPPPANTLPPGHPLLSSSSNGYIPAYADLVSSDGKDKIFGMDVAGSNRGHTFAATFAAQSSNYNNDDDVYSGQCDDYDDDGGDDGGGGGAYDRPDIDSLAEEMGGLAINQSNLLQASRLVEKVNIGYSKVSKRVNIQKLKSDIWHNIHHTLEDEQQSEREESESMSFQGLIQDLATNPRQKDVTVSFYFICLLHLANENTLRLEDQEDLADLRISVDK